MFCYQCEQTSKGTGCHEIGVCGKDAPTAAAQDLLVHSLKGIAAYAHRARQLGALSPEVDHFTLEALFATGTNVNFDAERLMRMLDRADDVRRRAQELYEATLAVHHLAAEPMGDLAAWRLATTDEARLRQAELIELSDQMLLRGPDITGLEELILYGLKGVAAYAEHARQLGKEDAAVYAGLLKALAFLSVPHTDAGDYLAAALETGALNLRVMELLDAANTDAYGHPVPTPVRIHPLAGKAILVSGHDLADLHSLLEQTAGLGINVYTHGEMLPAHGYPELKKYRHLAGNFGGAWMDQIKEFDAFPGAILMTSNCIQKPKPSYMQRIFSSGPVGWPDVVHIADRDFSPVIRAALEAPGFAEDGPADTITVGFGHNAVMSVAGAVIDAVKAGAVKHFFLIGGCDGARSGRNYYTDLALALPQDCVILTLACGKFRFNKHDFGTVGGLPRLLDLGQCNDAYSAILVAQALAGAFNCGVNDLPLSLVLSWYEQKAVAILLTLLHLGIRNIRIGPTLPAFVTAPVLGILQEKFNLQAVGTVEADLAAILQ